MTLIAITPHSTASPCGRPARVKPDGIECIWRLRVLPAQDEEGLPMEMVYQKRVIC